MFVFRIKEVRKEKNITLYKLAKATGVSRGYLYDLENNKKCNPSLATMYKISEVLDVDIRDLFYASEDVNKLKKELYRRIDKFGLNSKEALEVSQILDLLINIDLKEQSQNGDTN